MYILIYLARRERNRKREREREHNLVIGVIGFGRLPIKRPDR